MQSSVLRLVRGISSLLINSISALVCNGGRFSEQIHDSASRIKVLLTVIQAWPGAYLI